MINLKKNGFSLVEVLAVISIIAVLGSIIFISVGKVLLRARDTKRKADLSQIGRFILSSSCYVPDVGAGDYDLKELADELIAKYPQYANLIASLPKDPKTGSETITNYRYKIAADGHCSMYANFENEKEEITLSGLSVPAPNTGIGVLKSSTIGPNGTAVYYQISK